MHQPGACPLENYSNDCSRVADLLKCKSTQLVSSVKSSVSLNFGYLCFFTSPKNDLSQLFLSIGDCLAFIRHYNEASFTFVQELFTAFLRRILSKLLQVCRNWESRQGLTMPTWMLNIKPKFIKDGQQIKFRLSKYFTWTYFN